MAEFNFKKFISSFWCKKINKIYTIIVSIIFILLITNPSNYSFDKYLSSKGYQTYSKEYSRGNVLLRTAHYGRKCNYFIFSIYEYQLKCYSSDNIRICTYIGIFRNFYELKCYTKTDHSLSYGRGLPQ